MTSNRRRRAAQTSVQTLALIALCAAMAAGSFAKFGRGLEDSVADTSAAKATSSDGAGTPTDASAVPTDASAVPTNASAVPTNASAVPTNASAVPTDASAVPTDASAETPALSGTAAASIFSVGRAAKHLDADKLRALNAFTGEQIAAMVDAQRAGFEIQVLSRKVEGSNKEQFTVLFGDKHHNTSAGLNAGTRLASLFELRGRSMRLSKRYFGLETLLTRLVRPRYNQGRVIDAVDGPSIPLGRTSRAHTAPVDELAEDFAVLVGQAAVGVGAFTYAIQHARGGTPSPGLDLFAITSMITPVLVKAATYLIPQSLETSRWSKALFLRFGRVRGQNIAMAENLSNKLNELNDGPMLALVNERYMFGLAERLKAKGFSSQDITTTTLTGW